tara:strand:+ start:536 stop:955 length:420 start_codon:yes stop_codon:yes gene_type:complete
MQDPKRQIDHFFGTPIHVYTRSQAIEDGVLVDVTHAAHGAGFRIPVAMTAAAWADCVAWDESDTQRQTQQDQAGRLWDVVWMAIQAARRAGATQRIAFRLHRIPRDGCSVRPKLTSLHLHIGPGDDPSPVITILMPDED